MANGYDGLDTVFVYNKTKVVEQTKRLKKWIDDGIMQIAGPGPLARAALHSRASARPSSPRRPRTAASSATPTSSGAPPTCRGRRARQPRNSSIGGATLWVMKGQKAEEYDGVADFLAFVASPDLQVWWSKVTGYVPITNKAYRGGQEGGLLHGQSDARDRHPAAQPRHADGQPRRASTSATTRSRPSRCARSWRPCGPTRRRRRRRSTTRSAAATRSCGSSRSCMQAGTSVADSDCRRRPSGRPPAACGLRAARRA